MNKYTSLETSKLIASKVPEGETDAWHVSYLNLGEVEYNIYSEFQAQRAVESGWVFEKLSRAYRLDDVLRAIQVWGEKKGTKEYRCLHCGGTPKGGCDRDGDCDAWCGTCGISWLDHAEFPDVGRAVPEYEYQASRLLTAYLAADGFGERSEGVLRDIFE